MPAESAQRWGVIGLGAQAEGIARALESVSGVDLVGCLSSTLTRTEEFATKFECTPYRSESELFSAGLDLIVVAGVNAMHARHCIGALQGGAAVLCEKPFTLTRSDAERVLEEAAAAGRPIFTGYHYRFRALSREMRDAVVSGGIGEVRDVHMQRTSEHFTETVRPWRQDLGLAGAGVMCDVGVHLVDFVTFVTGRKVLSVGAVADPPRASGRPDEHVVVSLELDNGALGTVDVARALPNGDNSLQVHGSEGSLFTGPLRWVDHFRFEVHRAKAEPRIVERAANAPLLDEMLAVRDAYLGNVSELLATGIDGLEGAAILEAIIKSLESGKRVLVPRP